MKYKKYFSVLAVLPLLMIFLSSCATLSPTAVKSAVMDADEIVITSFNYNGIQAGTAVYYGAGSEIDRSAPYDIKGGSGTIDAYNNAVYQTVADEFSRIFPDKTVRIMPGVPYGEFAKNTVYVNVPTQYTVIRGEEETFAAGSWVYVYDETGRALYIAPRAGSWLGGWVATTPQGNIESNPLALLDQYEELVRTKAREIADEVAAAEVK